MHLSRDGFVINLFCWKSNDLLELINCYCLDATLFVCLFVVVVVNSWIVASFKLLLFCVWVRGEGCICFPV